MSDDLGLLGGHPDDGWERQHRAEPARHEPGGGRSNRPPRTRAEARKAQQRRVVARRRRRTTTVLAVAVLLVLGGGVYFGGRALLGGLGLGSASAAADFTGGGVADIVVQVAVGDSTSAIAKTLTANGVVASATTFTKAATGNAAITAVQPGYYKLRTRLPAADAVTRLVSPDARVGQLVIPEGVQLDNVTGATGTVTDGILTRIQKASCVTLNGSQQCTSLDELRSVAATADPAVLGVPVWAVTAVTAVPDKGKRLEGLIRAGSYELRPAASAQEQLTQLLTDSAAAYDRLGLPRTKAAGLTPYQVLVTASLVQREALPPDFSKVARVVYNRLAVGQKLEFDSTVNYPLDVQAVATTDKDRAAVTPWNTYASPGLPATPISSPGNEALTAAEQPAAGTWLYFVTVDKGGTTVFSDTFSQHQRAIAQAQANGVFG